MLGKILNISSEYNPHIKNLKKISSNKKNHNLFFCEGEFFFKAALENNWNIQTIAINIDIDFNDMILNFINNCILKGVFVIGVNKKILSKLSGNRNNQNMVFTVKKKFFRSMI